MINALSHVATFMEACGQPVRYSPVTDIPEKERLLRIELLREELEELKSALGVSGQLSLCVPFPAPPVDKVAALDALTDLLYVLLGTVHTLGLSDLFPLAWISVHHSNLTKIDPTTGLVTRSPSGKILKPSTYQPPQLELLFTNEP